MLSMTGYGTFKMEKNGISVDVSVRSVNGRYLETRLHVPKEYFCFEAEIKKVIQNSFQRGTVDLYINRKSKDVDFDYETNPKSAKKWLKAYSSLIKELKLKGSLGPEIIFKIPDAVTVQEIAEISSDERRLLLQCLKKACEKAHIEKKREGKTISEDLLKLLSNLKDILKNLEAFREEANGLLHQKIKERIERMVSTQIEPQRLAQEVALLVDRSDIHEEIQRPSTHFKNFEDLIVAEGSEGKKLDFYTQELLREVNTIGPKSQVAKMTELVVVAESIVEKIREQVQNVE